jgi:hypothetical protein
MSQKVHKKSEGNSLSDFYAKSLNLNLNTPKDRAPKS